MRYEIAGFKQVSSTDLLYKNCKKGEVSDGEFEGKRENAFEQVENGVVSGNGFYAASYESVYVLGQCEGDLVGKECGECVKTGLERVKVECGNSVSGQVYLNQCYVSYTYYPNGVDEEKASSSGKVCCGQLDFFDWGFLVVVLGIQLGLGGGGRGFGGVLVVMAAVGQ
ncbi:Cysteine-rich repeat secretory protein 3 [Bienertia sinuspersici]